MSVRYTGNKGAQKQLTPSSQQALSCLCTAGLLNYSGVNYLF